MINLEKDEHVVAEIRKHWFTLAMELSALFLVSVVLFIVVLVIGTAVGWQSSTFYLSIFLFCAVSLILWIVSFIIWTNYYLDVWILTNKKIMDIEQVGLFHREISILHLDKIQDVTSEIKGMVATFVDYGDIHVQTAGQQREFLIEEVPRPDEVRRQIAEALAKFRDDQVEKVVISKKQENARASKIIPDNSDDNSGYDSIPGQS